MSKAGVWLENEFLWRFASSFVSCGGEGAHRGECIEGDQKGGKQMNGFASKDSVLQMLLETESDMSSAEKALTEAVRRAEHEKRAGWNERLDLIEKELAELSACLNSTLMGVEPRGETA
ncbi:hypothetical protein CHCC5022_2909 [Bacillus paralicheniformis]|nr:hypothetical protein CHCC5022_2909 [Bacillus paralicheniformis]